jgi:hypothetical protein
MSAGIELIDRTHAPDRARVAGLIEQATLHTTAGARSRNVTPAFLYRYPGLKMMPGAAIAAAMSLPVSAVATGSRTAFAALYRLCSRLKLLVSI